MRLLNWNLPDLITRDRHYNHTHHQMKHSECSECSECRIFCTTVVVGNDAYVGVFEQSRGPLYHESFGVWLSGYLTYDKTVYIILFQFIIYYNIYFIF